MSLEEWQVSCAAQCAPHYIPPSILVEIGRESALQPIHFLTFASKLEQFESPERWLVMGGPGSGKSALLSQLASRLSLNGQLTARIDAALLDRLPSYGEPQDLLRAIRPLEIDEALWRARIRKRRVLVLIDGINEIELKFAGTDRWRLIARFLRGPHSYSVVATSRYIPYDLLPDDTFDEIELAQLGPFDPSDIRNYLASRNLSAPSALSRIEAADLFEVARNPLLLRLIANHLLEAQAGELPRSRAGLFAAECERAARRSAPYVTRESRDSGLSLDAAFCAAMMAVFAANRAEIPSSQVVDLLLRASPKWNKDSARNIVDALAQHHLIITSRAPSGAALRPLHDTLIDFSFALAWRYSTPPDWLICRTDIEHFLGDWVGLQERPSQAAEHATSRALTNGRPGLVMDVLVANEGILDRNTLTNGWRTIGSFLSPPTPRPLREDASAALTRLSGRTAEDAIEAGLLRPLRRHYPQAAARVTDALLSGSFSSRLLQVQIRFGGGRPSRNRVNVASGLPHPQLESAMDDSRSAEDSTPAVAETGAPPDKLDRMLEPLEEEKLVQQLKDARHYSTHIVNVINMLAKSNSAKAIEALTTALSDRRIGKSRHHIVTALAATRNKDAVNTLVSYMHDPNQSESTRAAIAYELGALDELESTAELAKAATDSRSGHVQRVAMEALGKVSDPRGIETLISILLNSNENDFTRRSAAVRLVHNGSPLAMAAINDTVNDKSMPSNLRSIIRGVLAASEATENSEGTAPAFIERTPEDNEQSEDIRRLIKAEHQWMQEYAGTRFNDWRRFSRNTGASEFLVADVEADLAQAPPGNDLADKSRSDTIISLVLENQPSKLPDLRSTMFDQSEADDVRSAAAWAIGSLGDVSGFGDLLCVFGDETLSPTIRAAAAMSLGKLEDSRAVSPLALALQKDSPVTSVIGGFVCKALGRLADMRAAGPLIDFLKSTRSTGMSKGLAAQALGRIGRGQGIEAIGRALADRTLGDHTRRMIIEALGEFADPQASAILRDVLSDEQEHQTIRGAAAEQLGKIGDSDAAEALIQAMLDHRLARRYRVQAAEALGRIGDPRAVDPLANVLQDATVGSQGWGAAGLALGRIGGDRAIEVLIEILNDRSRHGLTRSSAARSLARIGDLRATETLIGIMEDSTVQIDARAAAAEALGRLGGPTAQSALVRALAVDNPDGRNLRAPAATALGRIGDSQGIPALVALVSHPLSAFGARKSAVEALCQIGHASAAEPLLACLGDTTIPGKLHNSIVKTLGRLGHRGAMPVLRSIIDDSAAPIGYRVNAIQSYVAISGQAPEWLIEFALDNTAPPGLKLAAISSGSKAGFGQNWTECFRSAAKFSGVVGARLIAIQALAARSELDEQTVRFLLDSAKNRQNDDELSSHDIILGQCCSSIFKVLQPGDKAIMNLLFNLLASARTNKTVIATAAQTLSRLPLGSTELFLNQMEAHISDRKDVNIHLREYLTRVRTRVRNRRRLAQDEEDFAREPEQAIRLFGLIGEKQTITADTHPRAALPSAPFQGSEKSKDAQAMRTAVLLTAAPIEAQSVYQGLGERGIKLEPLPIAGRTFEHGAFSGTNGASWRVVLVQPLEKGPHAMQSVVKDILAEMGPELLLMVGMCGGIEENGASENAVVVAKQVLNYEPQRLRPNGPSLAPSNYRCDPRIIDCVNAVNRRGLLESSGAGDAAIELLTKTIGSGEKLIDDLNSPERASIVRFSNDLVGVEQEGHGLYHPLWEDLLRGAPRPYALIKGVSDLVDGKMRENKLARQRRATLRALTVALAIIENFA